jgi:ferric-dicitrate binding protein FerR (iron transport regulator)
MQSGDFAPADALRLARYLRDELTAAERSDVELWIAADPERRSAVEQLAAHWNAVPLRQGGEYDVEMALSRVKRGEGGLEVPVQTSQQDRDGIGGAVGEPVRRIRYGRRSFARSSWRAGHTALAVAGLAALVIAGVVVVSRPGHVTPVAQAPQWREYTTGRGQLAEISLGDGTSVWLGPATSLRVAHDYGVTGRVVALDGEALFTVVHDAAKPFSVRTPRTVIEDLGTRFVVSDYRGDRTVQVAVASGIVALQKSTRTTTGDSTGSAPRQASITMTRGDLAQIDSAGVMTLRSDVDVDQYLSWTRGALTFNHTPLRDAIGALNRWYDADVRLSDPALGKEMITATLNTESFMQALQVLQTVLDVKIEQHAKTVTLSRNKNGR